jgi:hypothetical protein
MSEHDGQPAGNHTDSLAETQQNRELPRFLAMRAEEAGRRALHRHPDRVGRRGPGIPSRTKFLYALLLIVLMVAIYLVLPGAGT